MEDNTIKKLEEKMHTMVDELIGRNGGMVKVASPNSSMANHNYRSYRSTFLTMGDMQIPDDYREIFKWCRYFFKFDAIVGGAVRALATFPITDYVVNDSEAAEEDENLDEDEYSDEYQFYKQMLSDLNLFKHMNEIGYDYWLYGNVIVFAQPGTKVIRRRDPDTNEITESKQVVWKSVQRLDPSRIRIERDPSTNEKIFYYDIPEALKAVIKKKKPAHQYKNIPAIFKEAVKKNGILRLNSKFVYHFAMPTESGDSGDWATPPVLHAMKIILYKNILRQAQEAIAHEHIVPKRVYYFQETTATNAELDFGRVADDFAFELKKQLNDPNYQIVSPVPVQQLQHGGQGRNLLLVPEIEQLDNTILASMNVPREFIFGGVSYSGSTTSLRILENNFITYRMLMEEYVNNFLIKRLAEVRGEWEVSDDDNKLITVSFADLKMQDDIQQKELMIRLNGSEKLPDDLLYEKVLGLDSTKVNKMMVTERKRKLEEQFELQGLQVEQQRKFEAKYGAQMAAEGGQPLTNEQAAAQGQGEAQGGAEQGQAPQEEQQYTQQDALAIAQELMKIPESQVEQALASIPESIRTSVNTYYLQMKDQEEMQTDMRPAPDQLPPRREGGV